MLLSRVFHAFGLLTWITINQVSETNGQEECYSMTMSTDNLEEKLNDLAAKIKPKIEDGALEITSSIDVISFHHTNSYTSTSPQIDKTTNRDSQSHGNARTTTPVVTDKATKANTMNTTPLSHKSPESTSNSNNPDQLYTDMTTNRDSQSHSNVQTTTPAVTDDPTKAHTINTRSPLHKSPESTSNYNNTEYFWMETRPGTTFQKAQQLCSEKNALVATILSEIMYQEIYDVMKSRIGEKSPMTIWISMTYDSKTKKSHPIDAFYKWRDGAPKNNAEFTNMYIVVHKEGSTAKEGMWNNVPTFAGDGTVYWKPS